MTKKQILVIDDDVTASSLVKASLERTGAYEVRTENAGTRGLTAAKQFKPDLILLDVDMPDMDGGEVAFQIRADKQVKHTPIVFLTSMVSKEETQGRINRWGYEMLAKPVDVRELIERIETILGNKPEPQGKELGY
jgi:DNA-binding response OmpR family regulator